MPAAVASTFQDDGGEKDDFQFHTAKKKNSNAPRRVYIGGLPNDLENLQEELKSWIQEQVPSAVDVSIEVQSSSRKGTTSYFALVDCGNQANLVISKCHQKLWHGKKLTVQREKKQPQQSRNNNNNPNKHQGKKNSNHKKNNFYSRQQQQSWGKSWSKPEAEAEPVQSFTPIPVEQATEEIAAVVESEIQNAQETGDDVINVALASTAAASLLAAMNAFDDGEGTASGVQNEEISPESKTAMEKDTGGFKLQDMSTLLADFGEQDKDWKKKVVDDVVTEEDSKSETISRLAPHGKAPIHIVFSSFGYNHGAPKRPDGWSISQPLAPLDCSDYEPVPQYLKWMSGLSGAVKRVMDPNLLDYARTIVADQVWDCLVQAQDSGYGYASPLTMTIYLGSETGRHRSVAACEKAATELRKRLRANDNNIIRQPVSVGTMHRDVDKNTGDNNRKKKKSDDSDDEEA